MSKNSGSKIISASRCRWRDFARNWFFSCHGSRKQEYRVLKWIVNDSEIPQQAFPVSEQNARDKSQAQESRHIHRSRNHGKVTPAFQKSFISDCFLSTQNTNRMSSNSSRLKIEKLLFCDELFRTVGLTTKINLGLKFPWHSIDKPKRHTCHPSTIYGEKVQGS